MTYTQITDGFTSWVVNRIELSGLLCCLACISLHSPSVVLIGRSVVLRLEILGVAFVSQ